MPRLRYDDDKGPEKPIVQARDDGGAIVTMPEGVALPNDLDPDAGQIEDRQGRARGRPRHGQTPAPERIRQLNGALHQARNRESATAAELERTRGELAKANGTAAMLDQAAFENWGREAEGRHAKAASDLATARDNGDTKAEAAAFSDLSVAAVDVASYKRNKVGRDAAAEARTKAPLVKADAGDGAMSRATKVFIDANPDVREDNEMWGAAMKLHQAALKTEGLDADSPEYFDYITSGLRDEFPDAEIKDHPDFSADGQRDADPSRLDDDGGRNFRSGGRRNMRQDDDDPPARRENNFRRPSGAAAVNRRTGGAGISTDNRGRVRVELTADHIEAAKISGVTPAQYAASLTKPGVKRRVDEAIRRGG